jgi:hypothetical protein
MHAPVTRSATPVCAPLARLPRVQVAAEASLRSKTLASSLTYKAQKGE